MDALWQLVDTGLAGVGSVFRAETQTRGRGRRGHTWDSRPGLGLWFSIVLPVAEESRILMAVTAAVSVAVVRTLRAFLPGHESRIRWPNDIRIEGRKLCGILVETRTDHPGLAIAGIGLDVLHTPLDFPPELRDQATSLARVAGRPLDREPIFVRLLDELDIVVASLSCSAIEEIERPWREASETLGSEVEIEFDGQRFQGRVKSLSLQQGLTLEFPDGEERTFRGEHVQLLD